MTVRLAWHASGTYDRNDNSGGSNGATMRYDPELSDDANKGLNIIRSMLHPVTVNHPEVSVADVWAVAGAHAVELLGGPKVPVNLGRADAKDASTCPANGRLPDASKGADHLREVFYRMGFNDQEIVALSGAHTLGRCHIVRSGFDGPWTTNPLRFDNEFFRNLINLTWKKREWEGNEQFEDVETGKLMMLPTDLALVTDAKFKPFVEAYAKDQELFFKDFASAFSKLLALGVPERTAEQVSEKNRINAEFREAAMHGSLELVKKLSKTADINEIENSSGRTALHKAAFWGHEGTIKFLTQELKLNVNQTDYHGDTALHDAARFGHASCVSILLDARTDTAIKNRDGKTALDVARDYNQPEVVNLLNSYTSKL